MKCIEDEIPFEVPDGWEWRRLKTICSKIIDGAHNPPKGLDTKTSYIMASSRNINFDTICDLDNVRYLDESAYTKENQRTNVSDGDILLTTVGTLGRSCIYRGYPENLTFQRSVSVITTLVKPDYIKIFLDSHFFQNKMKAEATGTAQRGFYLNQLINILIPVPPERYQKVLAGKVQEYSMQLNNIDDDKADLNETISIIKNKILDLAIHGKLTIQNPNDEPASILLDRIRNEKENFIKQGRIKRDKKESIIYKGVDNSYFEKYSSGMLVDITEDIPYDLPQKWIWCRLKDIVQIINGDRGANYPAKSKLHDSGIPFVSASNIDDGIVAHESGMKYLSQEQYELLRAGLLQYNDIVYCIRGSLGKCGKFPYEKGAIASSLVIVRPFAKESYITDYLMIYLNSALSFSEIKKYDNGTAQPNLAAKDFENFLIPLPPLNMINLIVEKYNQLTAEVSIISEAV